MKHLTTILAVNILVSVAGVIILAGQYLATENDIFITAGVVIIGIIVLSTNYQPHEQYQQ